MWQLPSSAPGPPCLSASLPIVLRTVFIMLPPSPDQRFHHGPLPTELSSLLLGLHTWAALIWIRQLSGLSLKSSILLFKPPSGVCCTSPPHTLCPAVSCLLLASLPAWRENPKLGCSVSSGPDMTPSSNSQGCCIPLLTSHCLPRFLLSCRVKAAVKIPGRSQLN